MYVKFIYMYIQSPPYVFVTNACMIATHTVILCITLVNFNPNY